MKKNLVALAFLCLFSFHLNAWCSNQLIELDAGFYFMGDNDHYDVSHSSISEFCISINLYKSDNWRFMAGWGLAISEASTSHTPSESYYSELTPVFVRSRYFFYENEHNIHLYGGMQAGYDFSEKQDHIVTLHDDVDIVWRNDGFYNRGWTLLPTVGLEYGDVFFELGYRYHYTDIDDGYSLGAYMFRFGFFLF